MKYDYDFFEFPQLWILNNPLLAELEYDLMFGRIITDYEKFLLSDSNDDSKGLYECIIHYFINK